MPLKTSDDDTRFDLSQAKVDEEFKKIADAEEKGGGSWADNTSPGGGSNSSESGGRFSFFRKKGPLIGIGGGLGIAGFMFAGLLAPFGLIPSLSMNAISHNDTRGSILERRLIAALSQKMSDKSGPCTVKKVSCLRNKMPKKMLASMASKGIVAYDASGAKVPTGGDGYVDINPTEYEISDGKGGKKKIPASKFADEYKNNPVFRKVFKSAYNMRFLSYVGKYMSKNFFKKKGLSRNGGMAGDKDLNTSNAGDKLDEKLKPKSGASTEDGAKNTFKQRVEQLIKRTGSKVAKGGGDPILTAGTLACTAINMPRFITNVYRTIQAAQVILLVNDLILSPGGMVMAGDAKPAKIAALGALLTERPKGTDGTFGKSALDSKILMNAIGVNKNRVGMSKLTPGYSMVTNLGVQTATDISSATKEACDLIYSPQAALGVAGIEGAITAASAGTGGIVIGALKGIGKLAVIFGVIDFVIQKAEEFGIISAIADGAYGLAKDFIGNYVQGARGEELGDALGMGINAYFPQAGLAGGAAVLKTSEVAGFNRVIANVDDEYRQEDIATLSPFDTSSQYTFLGSIVSNLALHSVVGNPIESSLSMMGYIIGSPLSMMSSVVSAQSSTSDERCGYAAEFGIDENIAVNPSGYPCVGIPSQYIDMPRDDVFNLVSNDVDENTGEPKSDSDIMSMMADCSDGDLESLAGCTISGSETASVPPINICDEDGKCQTATASISGSDAQTRAAQSLYLFDQQVENILNGSDEEDNLADSVASSTIDIAHLYDDSTSVSCAPGTTNAGTDTGYNNSVPVPVQLCDIPNSIVFGQNHPVRVNSRVSGAFLNLINAYLANTGQTSLTVSDSFRTMAEQQAAFDKYGSPRAALPGKSNHQMGLAVDFQLSTGNTGSTKQRGSDPMYDWLTDNAARYGITKISSEAWHWQPIGAR